MVQEELYKIAEKRVDEKIGFLKHLYSYITVNIILFVINLIFNPYEWWFMWVSLFWGIGLISHFLKVYILFDKFVEKYRNNMIKKEINKIR